MLIVGTEHFPDHWLALAVHVELLAMTGEDEAAKGLGRRALIPLAKEVAALWCPVPRRHLGRSEPPLPSAPCPTH